MSQVPFSEFVSVVPGVLAAAGSAVDLTGVMLTTNTLAPSGQLLSFGSSTSVSDYFGASSTEAAQAAVYFKGFDGCTKLPGNLMMIRYPTAAIGAFVCGGSLSAMTLTQLQALSGTLIVNSNGVAFTSATINLSTATSFSDAATKIAAGFTTPTFTVAYSSVTGGFVFASTTTGVASTLTYFTGTLSTSLKLTQATAAVLSQGDDAAVPGTFMTGVVAKSQNWFSFTTLFEPDLANKKLFSDWANSVAPRYLFVGYDSDINVETANSTATWGNYLQVNQSQGSMPIYGTMSHASFMLGFFGCLDFTRLNGRATAAYKAQSGLTAYVSTQSAYEAAISNGYNCYLYAGANNPANNANWFMRGSVSGKWLWADTYANQVWLNANMQLAVIVLLQSVASIPYNDEGYGLVEAALQDPINNALNFGAIRAGIVVSASQKAQMQFALGLDVSDTITAQGYYLQITPATAGVRAARQSPSITLYYQDGESIQQINMASIAIQ